MSFLRRRAPAPAARVITASGRRIDLGDRSEANRARRREKWQPDAWAYRDSIGEIRYAMAFLRHAVSQLRLVAAVANPNGEEPTPIDEAEGVPPSVAAAAADALARLTGGTFNYAPLLSPYAENLEVPGECMLVGYTDADTDEERWVIRSVDEVVPGERGWRLIEREADSGGIALRPDEAYVARLWQPHPRWFTRADSPMRALLDTCEELQLVGRMIRAVSRSRIATAGILAIANEFDTTSSANPNSDDPDADPFMAEMIEAAVANLKQEGDASSVVPLLLRGPGEHIEKGIQHITLDRPIDAGLLDREEKALARIATGLDVPPEILTGMAGVNHWTAWQIDESTFRHHLEPLAQRMADGLTIGYYRAALAEYGVPPEWVRRLVIWYDPTQLVTRPNRSEDAEKGHDRGVLSDVALVEALGFNPDTDMPDDDELARRMEWRRAARGGTPNAAGEDTGESDTGEPTTGIRAAATPAEQPAAVERDAIRFTPDAEPARVLRAYPRESRRLTDIDRALRDRLTAAADAAVRRALERAGNRVRTQANRDPAARDLVAAVPPRRAYAALPAALVAALGIDIDQLLEGAWSDLREQWDSWTADARTDALRTAAALAGLDPDAPAAAARITAADARYAANADQAWTYLTGELDTAVAGRLSDPDLDDPASALGETDRSMADPGIIRGALAVLGGLGASSGGVATGGVAASPGERVPGLATGDVVDGFLRDQGTEIVAYEWVYGISVRHFEPHRALDGVVFAEFGDPVLANPRTDGWPAATLAPGDHRGCHCDAAPIYADGLNSADALDQVGDATYDPAYMDLLRRIAADDLAAGRTDTTAVRTVRQADRVAAARPSRGGN